MGKTGYFLGIPYDIRMPTTERIKERFWNPDDPRIMVPKVFVAGWDINLGRLKQENVQLFRVVVFLCLVALANVIRTMRRKFKKGR